MALVIFDKNNKPSTFNVPITAEHVAKIREIAGIAVHADGHEHALIMERFRNLPSAHASTYWEGEFARFILENIGCLQS